MHSHNTIFKFIQNKKFLSTINLHTNNPLHHMFYDQMLIGSKLLLSPQLKLFFNYPPNIKKIVFNKINYYDIYHPPFELNNHDIQHIQNKFKTLYLHGKFIPNTPYLGFQENEMDMKKRDWYIWSYTPIEYIDSNNEFMNKLFDLGYPKIDIFNKYIFDSLIEYDCSKKKNK
jgi:hypothetical protein